MSLKVCRYLDLLSTDLVLRLDNYHLRALHNSHLRICYLRQIILDNPLVAGMSEEHYQHFEG
jgi:hypothetical protein